VIVPGEGAFDPATRHLPVATFRADPRGRITAVNERWVTVTGLDPEDVVGRPWSEIAHPADRAELVGVLAFAQEIGGGGAEFRFERRDATIWLDLAVTAVRGPSGALEEFVGTVTDVTERRGQATDLDRYRSVAEVTSDLVLVGNGDGSVAYINPAAREWFGIGDDDVVTNDLVPPAFLERYYDEIRPALLRTNRWSGVAELPRRDGTLVAVEATITAGTAPGDEVLWLVLAARPVGVPVEAGPPPAGDAEADAEADVDRARRREDLLHQLARGVSQNAIVVLFEPVARVDGGVHGVTAVAYLRHRERGLVPVRDVLGGSDPGAVSGPLGMQVLRSACRQARTWERVLHDEAPRTFVPISGRGLVDEAFARTVVDLLDDTGLEPGRLALVVPESVLSEHDERALANAVALDDAGVKLVLSGFGSGPMSLPLLGSLPISAVEVGPSPLVPGPHGDGDPVLLKALTGFAHDLGLEVLAAGVDGPERFELFRGAGVDAMRGSFIGRARPAVGIPDIVGGTT